MIARLAEIAHLEFDGQIHVAIAHLLHFEFLRPKNRPESAWGGRGLVNTNEFCPRNIGAFTPSCSLYQEVGVVCTATEAALANQLCTHSESHFVI
jgi:hypothetical protein